MMLVFLPLAASLVAMPAAVRPVHRPALDEPVTIPQSDARVQLELTAQRRAKHSQEICLDASLKAAHGSARSCDARGTSVLTSCVM